jgi:hypothetical protein
MIDPGAAPLVTVAVPARPAQSGVSGLWTPVHDFVSGPCVLSFRASGVWSYSTTVTCTADGDPASLLQRARCLFADGPVGALIGKIGGSSAGVKDGTIFLIGRAAVVSVDAPGGPLYLTINDESSGMDNNDGAVTVVARILTSPATLGAPDA